RLLGRAIVAQVFDRGDKNRNGGFPRKGARFSVADGTSRKIAASYANCHAIARAAHSNFYPAFFLLPRAKRDGIVALYAFMRLIDDVSDEGANLADKQRGLATWRAALDQAISGQSQVFDGNAAMESPASALPGADEVLPALVDTMGR